MTIQLVTRAASDYDRQEIRCGSSLPHPIPSILTNHGRSK
jgi:hypothetical protein